MYIIIIYLQKLSLKFNNIITYIKSFLIIKVKITPKTKIQVFVIVRIYFILYIYIVQLYV